MNWIWITTTKAPTYLDKHDCRHDIIMTDEVELLNMIFQHMFLSGKTDVDRSAGAFSRRRWCVAIFKCGLTFMKCFAAQPFLVIPARSLRRNIMMWRWTLYNKWSYPFKGGVGLFLKVLHRSLTAPLVAKLAPPVAPPKLKCLAPPLEGCSCDYQPAPWLTGPCADSFLYHRWNHTMQEHKKWLAIAHYRIGVCAGATLRGAKNFNSNPTVASFTHHNAGI